MLAAKWDIETDVVVVGYGLAGATAAIAAHDVGAEVLLIEKMPTPGGNSIMAGGSLIWSSDAKEATKYLRACSDNRVDQSMIDYMARGMVEFPAYLIKLVEDVGAVYTVLDTPYLFYPFPGKKSFKALQVVKFKDEADFDAPGQSGEKAKGKASHKRVGGKLMMAIFRNVEKRRIKVMLTTPAERLVQNSEGRIIGVIAESQDKQLSIRAKKGVILSCGGFEFNDWLLKQYCEIQPIYPIGAKGNTGDGIMMSQKVGAALWHMWLLHASYGFKFPEYDYAFRTIFGGALDPANPADIAWIVVNRYGKRFMNEAIPFLQDASYRYMQSMDCDFMATTSGVPEYPNIPCYMIFDEEGRKIRPIARPLTVKEEDAYHWSPDNMTEIEKGWIKQAATISELADMLGINATHLKQTVERWNNQCPKQKDTDFSRGPGSMVPIEKPPFYCIICWPILTNTQGGPQFNTKCQIVDPYNEPIPGLYKAGELGSFFGHLYTLGANLSECIIEGRTAGENAARESGF